MFNRKKVILFIFLMALIIFSSSYIGYYYMKPKANVNFNSKDMVTNTIYPIITNTIVNAETKDKKDVIGPNTTIQYNYRTNGKLTDSITEKATLSLINLTKEELKETLSDVEIKQFSKDLVVLEKNIFKTTSYIIGNNDGFIAIYMKDFEDNIVLYNQTKIPVDTLPEEDIKLLEKGIIANDRAELGRIIEDYTS